MCTVSFNCDFALIYDALVGCLKAYMSEKVKSNLLNNILTLELLMSSNVYCAFNTNIKIHRFNPITYG